MFFHTWLKFICSDLKALVFLYRGSMLYHTWSCAVSNFPLTTNNWNKTLEVVQTCKRTLWTQTSGWAAVSWLDHTQEENSNVYTILTPNYYTMMPMSVILYWTNYVSWKFYSLGNLLRSYGIESVVTCSQMPFRFIGYHWIDDRLI